MAGVILDSSVYIDSFRRGDFTILSERRMDFDGEGLIVYLSAVVLSELYAGATNSKAKERITRVERDFEKGGRLLTATRGDWAITGQTLLKIGKKYGFETIGRSRLTNDCLIAITARRAGLILVTGNAKDFRLIAEFRPFRFEEI